jgi:hypothetical protein
LCFMWMCALLMVTVVCLLFWVKLGYFEFLVLWYNVGHRRPCVPPPFFCVLCVLILTDALKWTCWLRSDFLFWTGSIVFQGFVYAAVPCFLEMAFVYCTFASCRTLLLHFHFSFRLLCGLSMFLNTFSVLNTFVTFITLKL